MRSLPCNDRSNAYSPIITNTYLILADILTHLFIFGCFELSTWPKFNVQAISLHPQ
jgi:hypothetical protein